MKTSKPTKTQPKRGPLLFSVTRKDFTMERFRCGGKGGQNVNKVETGVRLIHEASGARAESREERSFEQNRRNAFKRIIETPKFKAWHKLETARKLGQHVEIEDRVNQELHPSNLKIEGKDDSGKWTPLV